MMMQTSSFSPGKAAMLALIPGMGAAYNRQYDKAVAHFGMFAALCIVCDEGHGIFALAAIVFYIFTILDAYRSAQSIVATGRVPGTSDSDGMNLPLWGGILILLGLLFFLDNLGAIRLSWVLGHSWPLIFVGTGIYLIFRYYVPTGSTELERPAAEAPVPPSSPPLPPTSPPVVSPPGETASGSEKLESE